jgi:hypothetical protein
LKFFLIYLFYFIIATSSKVIRVECDSCGWITPELPRFQLMLQTNVGHFFYNFKEFNVEQFSKYLRFKEPLIPILWKKNQNQRTIRLFLKPNAFHEETDNFYERTNKELIIPLAGYLSFSLFLWELWLYIKINFLNFLRTDR